jgi:nucleoside phosphorylase
MDSSILRGKLVLVAGSASPGCGVQKLTLAHDVVRELSRLILDAGAGLVVFASGEPTTDEAPLLPLIFDWAILREVDALVARKGDQADRCVTAVTSQKAWTKKMSEDQRQLLVRLSRSAVVEIVYVDDEVHTGGNIGDEQVQRAHAMIALGGGKGVTDRAQKAMRKGAPVLPLDLQLGALSGDGDGAVGLHRRLLVEPQRFFPHTHVAVRNHVPSLSLEVAGADPRMIAARVVELVANELVAAHEEAPVEVVVLTALPVELAACTKILGLSPGAAAKKTASGTAYWTADVYLRLSGRNSRVALACIGGSGNVDAAASVTELLTTLRPKLVLMVGIAAGMRGKCKLGEVVFSERVVAYEPAAVVVVDGASAEEPRPESFRLAHAVLQDVVAYLANADELGRRLCEKLFATGTAAPSDASPELVSTDLTARLATIASGEKLLRDPEKFRVLRSSVHGKIEVGEMESAGVATACHHARAAFLVVRGISDFGDDAKDDRCQSLAATRAAIVAADFLLEGLQLDAQAAGDLRKAQGPTG